MTDAIPNRVATNPALRESVTLLIAQVIALRPSHYSAEMTADDIIDRLDVNNVDIVKRPDAIPNRAEHQRDLEDAETLRQLGRGVPDLKGVLPAIQEADATRERQRIRHEIELMIERGDYYEPEHDVMAFDLKDILRVIGDV